jgi:hypothetical protein
MMLRRNSFFLPLLFLLFSPAISQAQYLEYGLGLGQSVYWGDLNTPEFSTNLSNRKWAGQAFIRYSHTQNLSFKVNLMYGKLYGDDRKSNVDWQQLRNLRFESHIVEASLLGEYYIFGIDYNAGKIFSPFVTTGFSLFNFNPTTDFEGGRVDLQPLGTEGQGMSGFRDKYSTIAFSIPFGAGAKIAFSEKFSVNIDIIGRRTFTDYLDDVSDTYVNYNELLAGNGPLAASLGNRQGEALGQSEPVLLPTGTKRGGELVRDYFFTFMVSVNYYLGPTNLFSKQSRISTTNCPTF